MRDAERRGPLDQRQGSDDLSRAVRRKAARLHQGSREDLVASFGTQGCPPVVPAAARAAIAEMHRQVGVLRFDSDGLARRGVLVRHLVMPGLGAESAAIFEWLADELSPDTYVNIMGQYRPEHRVPGNERYGDIDRRPDASEMRATTAAARRAGLWRFDQR